eukprot:7442860-Karenia_brevis.AAC.1
MTRAPTRARDVLPVWPDPRPRITKMEMRQTGAAPTQAHADGTGAGQWETAMASRLPHTHCRMA